MGSEANPLRPTGISSPKSRASSGTSTEVQTELALLYGTQDRMASVATTFCLIRVPCKSYGKSCSELLP